MPGVIIMSASPASGTLIYEWVDPTGVVRALSGNQFVNVEVGERGLGLPGLELAEDKLPFTAGTVVRHAAINAREIELPLLLSAGSASALEGLLDDVLEWFATADEETRTPGYLRVTRQDASVRQIKCFYSGGLDGDLSTDRAGDTWQSVVVTLKAADPWATDADATVSEYDETDLGDDLTVTNPGQLDAYPIWTITGPCSAITITNVTTGKAFALTANGGLTLGIGELLTIDTRPASQRTALPILDDSGGSQFSKLTATSSLWRLQPGLTHFTIEMTGTSGVTAIELSYLARYRGLLR